MTQYKVLETPTLNNNLSYKLLNLQSNQEEIWERFKIIRRFPINSIIEIIENENEYIINSI
jgi:hypothetical protein